VRLFLIGPLRNDADRAALVAAESALRAIGQTPCFGPHDIRLADTANPDELTRERMRLMTNSEACVLIDGWGSDHVCEFEHQVAKRIGLKCTPLVVLLSQP